MDDPEIITKRFDDLIPDDVQCVLVDTQPGLGSWSRRVVSAVDAVIVVLTADGSSYATLPMLSDMLDTYADCPVKYLVNMLDLRWQLSRDVRGALMGSLGDQMIEWAVPFDPALPEALARRRMLFELAPDAQALETFRNLAEYVRNL